MLPVIAGLHDSGPVLNSDSDTESDYAKVFTRAAPLSVLLKWVSTSADPAAWCRCEMALLALFS